MNRAVRPFETELQGSLKLSCKTILKPSYKALLKLSYKAPELHDSLKLSYYIAPKLHGSLATWPFGMAGSL